MMHGQKNIKIMHTYIITVYITEIALCNLHCYMFRHFHVIIRQFKTNALLSCKRTSNCSFWKNLNS